MKYNNSKTSKVTVLSAIIASIIAVNLSYQFIQTTRPIDFQDHISTEERIYGATQCKERYFKSSIETKARTSNPRYKIGLQPPGKPTLIKNATLINGDGSIRYEIDILLKNGIFAEIGTINVHSEQDWEIIQLNGQIVTPGIVTKFY